MATTGDAETADQADEDASTGQAEVRTAEDPTKAILSESALNKKYLCDYVINVATGCRHGCKFCYVPATPNIRARPEMLEEAADVENPQHEWGDYVLYREQIIEEIDGLLERKRKWRKTPRGQGIVGISFATDCYMDGRAGKITRETVRALAEHGRYARVLTRNPILALQDADVFRQAGEYVTIGSSIPCMDSDKVQAIEPRAPSPEHRLRGLEEFNNLGVNTYVSLSPTYPTQDYGDLRAQLERIAACDPDVVFHEPINPRSGNFAMTVEAAREAGEDELAEALDTVRDQDVWLQYSLRHFAMVQEIAEELGIPIHLWPDDQHLKLADGPAADWMQAWQDRQSPETFAGRPTADGPLPQPPERISHR
jgi:DNA repair photolyase